MDTQFSQNDMRAIAAEFFGTLFFVFVSTGTVVAAITLAGDDSIGGGGLAAIALAFGLGILVAVAWTANLSGGHINPAVTLAMMVTKHIAIPKGIAYIVAQCAGGIVGSLLLKLSITDDVEGALGATALGSGMNAGEGFLLEAILTAFLVLVIYNVAVSNKGWATNAPIAIGLAVVLIHLVGVPFTGPSVNPARSLGPALVANEWDDFWIYVLGPAAGALVVAGFWLFWRNWGEDKLESPPTPGPEPAGRPGAPAARTDADGL